MAEERRTVYSPKAPLPSLGIPLGGLPVFFRFFMKRKFLGKPIPLLGSFKITYRCNLRCSGCPFHQRGSEPGSHMNRETALRVLARLHEAGLPIIIFEGGEPLLWRDGSFTFSDLVLRARKLFPRVAVTTNGTVPLDVPAHIFWVSLDGLRDTHNALRNGSFDRIARNLEHTTHRKVFAHVTLNNRNRHEIAGLAEWVRKHPKIRGMTVQLFYPYNRGEAPLALSPGERRATLEAVMDLKERGYPILNSMERLRTMIDNRWTCHDDVLINVDPDGTMTRGCYVKGRGIVDCRHCGFTPVAEASGALEGRIGALLAGWHLFIRP